MLGKRVNHLFFSLSLFGLILAAGCIPKNNGNGKRSAESHSNSPSSLAVGYGRALKDNPGVLGAPFNDTVDISRFLDNTPRFITDGQFLEGKCLDITGSPPCFEVRETPTSSLLESVGGKWGFHPSTAQFLQVHTFYHTDKTLLKFHTMLDDVITWSDSLTYTSIPRTPTYLNNFGYWNTVIRSDDFNDLTEPKTLKNYSGCNLSDNAQYEPATFATCYGFNSTFSKIKYAQDATIIYHELGHALIDVMMNSRNTVDQTIPFRSNLIGNNEAGSIAEGVSDYMSYFINSRESIGEWAFLGQPRPLSEDHKNHAAGISSDENSRLSYPTFVGYSADTPTIPDDEVHNNGQVISHFLVALTKDFQTFCGVSNEEAKKMVIYLLHSTFSELGDLTASGVDSSLGPISGGVNLNSTLSRIWNEVNYPVNFRSFAQTLAKYNFLTFIDFASFYQCYDQDRFEQLLDMYGLLLFDNYNEAGNNGNLLAASTPVNDINRLRSVNVPKSLIDFDRRAGKVEAFVFDSRASVSSAIATFVQNGIVATGDLSSKIESDLRHNNGNARVSPGEIVGIALNLFNNANSTLGGVQILANDWHHADLSGDSTLMNKPCPNFEDSFPLASELYNVSTDTYFSNLANSCNTPDPTNATPVCFIEYRDGSDTKWVTQEEYVLLKSDQLPAGAEDCLGGASDTSGCFIRAIRGLDTAVYGKIDAKKTWSETFTANNIVPDFASFIFFEVNPWTPPGANFNCRFRVRFSNCSDCFSENYTNFTDSYYSEATPFKVINLKFSVVD